MKRKVLALTLVTALIFSFLFCGILVQTVESQSAETIYIRADGSIEGTDKIHRDGDVYTLTGNIPSGIQVQKSYIIVDGAGYTLQGDGEIHRPTDIRGMGVEIVECKNVTIENLKIKEFTRGIRLTNSSDCLIYQNILANNSIGIEMGYVDESYSNNNTVSGNLIKENNAGIRLIYGSSNTISENIITANDEGVSIWGTSGNNIVRNNITSNNRGVYFETSGINIIHHNNFVNNTNDWWDYGLTPWPFQLPFSVNIWDDDNEGNYWDTYNGTDDNGDGIGDTPHELYENNTDRYPLMNPVTIPEFPEEYGPTTPTAEPFPTTLVIASAVAVVAVVGLGLLVYFANLKKRGKSAGDKA
jgi:parallel beta-helix repeat protein